ncbi:MAG: patatin family protein [Traorella sp.]
MKIGVVDVGGGLRGIYAAGVFDYCLDNDIIFDYCIGVSAGSANVAAFIGKQYRRNYAFYSEYSFRKEYMSVKNYVTKGNYIDLDYVYGTLSYTDGESPLDYSMIMENPSEMIVVATNALTGQATYFDKNDLKLNCYDIFKASSAIPFVCRPYIIDDIPYYDGALSDPVPIEKAFEYGCDKVILILTKPVDTIRNSKKDKIIANRIRKSYPNAAENLKKRAKKYNYHITIAKEYEQQGKLLIIAPNDTCGVDTLTKNKEALNLLYAKGYQDAQVIEKFLKI